jgi:Domain of unknown function (DUF5667)
MSKPEDILEKVLTGELTRQEAIELRPDMEDRLTLLSGLADDLRQLPQQAPDPDYRNRTRMRLLQHIQETERRRPAWRSWLDPIALPGWASRVSAVVIAGGGLTLGVTYASASALPDDHLYGVKRTVENVQLAMATSDEAKTNAYLKVADRRAEEIAAVAGDVSDIRLADLTQDYGTALQNVSIVVQKLSNPPMPLLDKVQGHVASQATELEARAVNSASKPKVQKRLNQAEIIAANVVDHVTVVAEKNGRPGAQDIHLAANAPAAATAAAETIRQDAVPTPVSTAAPPAPAVKPASNPPAPAASTPTALDRQFDQLWNDVANATFMSQRVRTQLEADVANAKQDTHTNRTDVAIADMNAFIAQLQAAVNTHQATQYTATRLTAQAKAILSAL